MTELLIEFLLLGLAGGLLGIFYRDCLKPKNMIFHGIYRVLAKWVHRPKEQLEILHIIPSRFHRFLAWIAFPLGYCIYCSTTWITIFICLIYLSSWDILPQWQDIAVGMILSLGVQHIIVASACRWLICGHPDLDKNNKETTQKEK